MKKNHTIVVRLSEEELKKLQQKAAAVSLNVSTYMRVTSLIAILEVKQN